jgi:hypothetical protein
MQRWPLQLLMSTDSSSCGLVDHLLFPCVVRDMVINVVAQIDELTPLGKSLLSGFHSVAPTVSSVNGFSLNQLTARCIQQRIMFYVWLSHHVDMT